MKNIIFVFVAVSFIVMALACTDTSKNTGSLSNDSSRVAVSTTGQTANVPIVDEANAPVFKFEKDSYDFGSITDGETVTYDFKFKNIGKSPLIITSATATCGCTIPEYPKAPIAPGKDGIIHVVFNSQGKLGMQNKVISIVSNTVPSLTEVHLIGDVKSVISKQKINN